MKYFKKNPTHVGSAFIESTNRSNTLGKLVETQKKINNDNIGRIFSPLTRDQEMVLASLTKNKRNDYKRILHN